MGQGVRINDRTGWPAGQWDDEPDLVVGVDEESGLTCVAIRNSLGAWCGYVLVPSGHRYFGQGYRDIEESGEYPDIHGGITFSGVLPDHPGTWALGFDCSHSEDYSPSYAAILTMAGTVPLPFIEGTEYRTLDFVKQECAKLAKFISKA